MPELCRLEYLTPTGWQMGHAGISLMNPERYVERLRERNKFGRVTILDAQLRPTDRVFVAPDLPDPAILVPSETPIPRLPNPSWRCDYCEAEHRPPHDGSCLL